jgi:hypothetical protein
MTPREELEQYEMLHRDFSKTYARVYKHVMDFYPQPQEFIKEATPEIDAFVEKLSAGTGKPEMGSSFEALFCFAKHFQTFAAEANDVFDEYKELHTESGTYIKNIFRLREKGPDAGTSEFARLIPVLSGLIGKIRKIEQRTDEAAKNLCQLQSEWRRIKENMDPAKKGNAWPL